MTFAEDYPFTDLLKKAGVNKAQLARRLGITPNAISAWKEKPPKYAVAFLEVLIAFNELKVDFIHLKCGSPKFGEAPIKVAGESYTQ